jgi:pSer/pThr/pTyr-binding forkhead associated (FHA) protein
MIRALAEGTTVLVGRDPDAGLVLGDPRVSGRHAELTVRQGRVVVRDLGSTAGTFVNGQRVEGTVEIAAGAEVRFGPTAFRLEAVPAAARG